MNVQIGMTTAQARRAFNRYMKEVLLPLGFFRQGGDYFRIVPDVALLWVNLQTIFGIGLRINFDALPCCIGLGEDRDGFILKSVANLHDDHWGMRWENALHQLPMEAQLDRLLLAFDTAVKPLLDGIDSADALYAFQDAVREREYSMKRFWTACQAGRYDRAARHLGAVIVREQLVLEDRHRTLDYNEAQLDSATHWRSRKSWQDSVDNSLKHIAEIEAEIAFHEAMRARLMAGNITEVDAMLRANLKRSADYFERVFGEKE